MDLTQTERLMLLNQYKILKALGAEESDDYDRSIEILTKGFKVFYKDLAQPLRHEMDESEGEFVFEVLQMYRAIENYKQDNPNDKEIAEHHFAGFDGNNEGQCHALVKFLIIDQKQWSEQTRYARDTDEFNSHWPMKGAYVRMLNAWNSLGKPVQFSPQQIRAILQVESEAEARR